MLLNLVQQLFLDLFQGGLIVQTLEHDFLVAFFEIRTFKGGDHENDLLLHALLSEGKIDHVGFDGEFRLEIRGAEGTDQEEVEVFVDFHFLFFQHDEPFSLLQSELFFKHRIQGFIHHRLNLRQDERVAKLHGLAQMFRFVKPVNGNHIDVQINVFDPLFHLVLGIDQQRVFVGMVHDQTVFDRLLVVGQPRVEPLIDLGVVAERSKN